MRERVFIGVDPGGSGGGIACIGANGRVWATKMPATERDVLDALEACLHLGGRPYAAIEKVHSMPKQGVSSSFKFGENYGGLKMALLALAIPHDLVTPQKWQKAHAIPKRQKTETPTQWKNRLKAEAQRLFPGERVTLATADALLLAVYARMTCPLL